MLLKHNTNEDSMAEEVFDFYYQITLDFNTKMLDWWKSQYEAENIDEESYIEEICDTIQKYFDVPLDTPEEIDEFINDSSEGEYFQEYFLVIRKQE